MRLVRTTAKGHEVPHGAVAGRVGRARRSSSAPTGLKGGRPAYRGRIDTVQMRPTVEPTLVRSAWDRRARRLLRLPPDGPRTSLVGATNAASRSIAISGLRCVLTYLVLPVLGPAVGLSGAAGPALGLVLSAVSIVAIVYAARRFFSSDHRLRWLYAGVGGAILLALLVLSAVDLAALGG